MSFRITNKVVLLNLALAIVPTTWAAPCKVEQITDVPPGFVQRYVAINYDGTRLAFSSEASLDPNNLNVSGSDQILLYDRSDASFTQITNNSVFYDVHPHLDDAGHKVVWVGPGSLYEIYFYDFAGGGVRQLTNTGDDTVNPKISGDGTTIAVESFAELDPSLRHDSGTEIYLIDTASGAIRGLTSTPNLGVSTAFSAGPHINHDGTVVAFGSNGRHDPSVDNSDGSFEVFLYRDDGSGFQQITNLTDSGFASVPDIDAGGARVTYLLQRIGPTGYDDPGTVSEIYLWDADMGTRLLHALPGYLTHDRPQLSKDGDRVLLWSTADLDPAVPPAGGTRQLFVLDISTGFITRTSGDVPVGSVINNRAINGDGTRIAFYGFDSEGGEEIFLATCPLDTDGDGLPDDIDPDAVIGVIEVLPDSTFAATGHRVAILAQLEAVEQKLIAGEIDEARELLRNLRKHVNGCGATADSNDWIVDCLDQLVVREAIDAILAAL